MKVEVLDVRTSFRIACSYDRLPHAFNQGLVGPILAAKLLSHLGRRLQAQCYLLLGAHRNPLLFTRNRVDLCLTVVANQRNCGDDERDDQPSATAPTTFSLSTIRVRSEHRCSFVRRSGWVTSLGA